MSVKLQITVTKEILEKSKNCGGIVGDCSVTHCAIAMAIRDIFPTASVLPKYVKVYYPNRTFDTFDTFDLPNKATRFICKFDERSAEQRVQMPEISFNVKIPDSIIEKINIDEIRPLLENHKTLKLI